MTTRDSGGQPWSGRELSASPFPGDDGRADGPLAIALARWAALRAEDQAADPGAEVAVVAALGPARVFTPVVAMAGEAVEMAVLTVTGPDGRRALPLFTSPGSLAAWRPDARPVPVTGRRAALAAVADTCDLLWLDPAGPVPYVLGRPALWACAQARPWTPPYADDEVVRRVEAASGSAGSSGRVEPAQDGGLRLVLSLPAGLGARQVDEMVATVLGRLRDDEVVTERVGSIAVTVVSA